MKNLVINGVIVFAAVFLTPQAAESQGTLYVSSLDQPSAGSLSVGSDSWEAAGFIRTGNNPGGYALDSIQLAMTPASGSPNGFTVMLYSANIVSQNLPGSSLGTLTGSSGDPVAAGLYTYTASGLSLSPSTDYYIVVTAGTPVASGAYAWSFENTAPAASSGGWQGDDGFWDSSDGSHWHFANGEPQFALTATTIPEPETLYLLGLPGVLFLVWRRWRASAQAR